MAIKRVNPKDFWKSETRVRLAEESEILARAARNANIGAWLVERKGGWAGCFHKVSSHQTEASAIKAKEALDQKIAKGF